MSIQKITRPLVAGLFVFAALFAATVSVWGFSNSIWSPVPAVAAGQSNAKAIAEVKSFEARLAAGDLEVATFGSGCFWCAETNFDDVAGVVGTISGYMGGNKKTADYHTVSTGRTKHIEVLQVIFDPAKIDYTTVLDTFMRTTDVVDGGGQFCDRGPQYRPAVFAHDDAQLQAVRKAISTLEDSKRFDQPLAVEVLQASEFYPAEDYHQNYHVKNPLRYKSYRYGCGRDRRIKALWGNDALTH
ncbi:MAG: peptide-methionine (S)-S-oxide reductase MsrA [Pseudomonadota bacterium]